MIMRTFRQVGNIKGLLYLRVSRKWRHHHHIACYHMLSIRHYRHTSSIIIIRNVIMILVAAVNSSIISELKISVRQTCTPTSTSSAMLLRIVRIVIILIVLRCNATTGTSSILRFSIWSMVHRSAMSLLIVLLSITQWSSSWLAIGSSSSILLVAGHWGDMMTSTITASSWLCWSSGSIIRLASWSMIIASTSCSWCLVMTISSLFITFQSLLINLLFILRSRCWCCVMTALLTFFVTLYHGEPFLMGCTFLGWLGALFNGFSESKENFVECVHQFFVFINKV